MNRRNGIASSVLLLVLCGILSSLISCKNALGVPMLGNKPDSYKASEIPVRVMLSDDKFPNYRTIVPEKWTDAKKTNLQFILEEEKTTGGTASFNTIKTYTWAQLKTKGTAAIALDAGSHTLRMTAKDAAGKFVLQSKKTVVNIGSVSYIDFIMYPYRETQAAASNAATGKVNIVLKYQNPEMPDPLITRVEATLTPYNTGSSSVGTAVGKDAWTTNTPQKSGSGVDVQIKHKFAHENVVAGVYTFAANLYSSDKDTDLISHISEIVIVDPTLESKAAILAPVNLKTPPIPPANFDVEYKRPTDAESKYTIKLTWEDRASTEGFGTGGENGFVVEIEKEGGSTQTYKLPANTEELILDGGALGAATKERLDLGNAKYKARIYAENKWGKSTVVDYIKPESKNFIHLNRITYDLDGGKFIQDPINDLVGRKHGSNDTIIAYYTVKASGAEFNLAGPAKLPSVYKMITGGAYTKPMLFKGWEITAPAASSGTIINSIPADETKAYSLKAIWKDEPTIAITFPSYGESAHIKDSGNYIDYKLGTTLNIPVNIFTERDITAISPTWMFDGGDVTSKVTSTKDTGTKTVTLNFDSTALAPTTLKAGDVHQILCTATVSTTNALGEAEDIIVSAYCYIRVTN